MEQIGYSIVDDQRAEVRFWGDTSGQCARVPDAIDWPSGDRSFCPSVGMINNGAKFVERWLDQTTQSDTPQPADAIAFDGTKVTVTRSLYVAPPPQPLPPTQEDYQAAIALFIDRTAQGRSYDSGISLAGYVTSTVPQWAAEATTFIAWRDQIWVYAIAQLALVQAGKRAQPTVQDFINKELPAIAWPA